MEIILYNVKKSSLLLIGILFFSSALAQNTERFQEVSASLGFGSPVGGSATPYIAALYTTGLDVNDVFQAGLTTGFELGLTTQLSLRAMIPFQKTGKTGAYLMLNGGASFFYDGTIPIISTSCGLFKRISSGKRFYLGPFLSRYYSTTDYSDEEKGWGGGIGLRMGWVF